MKKTLMNKEELAKFRRLNRKQRHKSIREFLRKANDVENRIEFWIESFQNYSFDNVKFIVWRDFRKYKEMVVPLLIQASYSKSESVRYWSIYFLLKACDPRSRRAFQDHLNDEWGMTIIYAAEGLYKLGYKEISRDRLLGLFLDNKTHRHTRKLAAEKLLDLGFEKVLPEGTFLDLSEIPPNHHDDFKGLYKRLS